jgi:hypothetical protein
MTEDGGDVEATRAPNVHEKTIRTLQLMRSAIVGAFAATGALDRIEPAPIASSCGASSRPSDRGGAGHEPPAQIERGNEKTAWGKTRRQTRTILFTIVSCSNAIIGVFDKEGILF